MEQIVLTPRLIGAVPNHNDASFEALTLPPPSVHPRAINEYSPSHTTKPQHRDKVSEHLYRDRSRIRPRYYPERGRTLERGRRPSYEPLTPPAPKSKRGGDNPRELRSTYQIRSGERVYYHTFDEVDYPAPLTPDEYLFRPLTDAQLRGQKRRERTQRRSEQIRRRWEEMGYVYDLEGALGFGEARGQDQGLISERRNAWFRCFQAWPWQNILLGLACLATAMGFFWFLRE